MNKSPLRVRYLQVYTIMVEVLLLFSKVFANLLLHELPYRYHVPHRHRLVTRVERHSRTEIIRRVVLIGAPEHQSKLFGASTVALWQDKRKSQFVIGWETTTGIGQFQSNGFGTIAPLVVAIKVVGVARRDETGDPGFVHLVFYSTGINFCFAHTFDHDGGHIMRFKFAVSSGHLNGGYGKITWLGGDLKG